MSTFLKRTGVSMKDKHVANLPVPSAAKLTTLDLIVILVDVDVPSNETADPAKVYMIGSTDVFDSIAEEPLNKKIGFPVGVAAWTNKATLLLFLNSISLKVNLTPLTT